jgi:hypothetical protein
MECWHGCCCIWCRCVVQTDALRKVESRMPLLLIPGPISCLAILKCILPCRRVGYRRLSVVVDRLLVVVCWIFDLGRLGLCKLLVYLHIKKNSKSDINWKQRQSDCVGHQNDTEKATLHHHHDTKTLNTFHVDIRV